MGNDGKWYDSYNVTILDHSPIPECTSIRFLPPDIAVRRWTVDILQALSGRDWASIRTFDC